MLAGVRLGDVSGEAADDDSELDLVIGLLRVLWDNDVVARAADRGCRLHKKDRLGGDCRTRLLSVQAVVETDRDDLRHRTDAWTKPRRARHERQGCRIEASQSVE